MQKYKKYYSVFCRMLDISPCSNYNSAKLLIFVSWIFTLLFFTGYDFIPADDFTNNGTIDYTQRQTEVLIVITLPPIEIIKFYRSEIGTVSSSDVIIVPHEIKLIERDRGPPFHIS
jgi:hypothetical protein